MLHRIAQLPLAGSTTIQKRHAANMKQVAIRIKSVASIQKITKAMKMVSASKLRHDENRMRAGKPWAEGVQKLFERVPRAKPDKSVTYVPVTGDRGLCGGVNSSVAKTTRLAVFENEAAGLNCKVFLMGKKGGSALKRLLGDRFNYAFEDLARFPFNFGQSSAVAARLYQTQPDSLQMVYNKYLSLIAYETSDVALVTRKDMENCDKLELSKALDIYTFEPPLTECGEDLHEFYYASALFSAALQGAASEQSSRMQAMENASKNAGEMHGKLELLYNKARQAKITTELCEIVSGASVL